LITHKNTGFAGYFVPSAGRTDVKLACIRLKVTYRFRVIILLPTTEALYIFKIALNEVVLASIPFQKFSFLT